MYYFTITTILQLLPFILSLPLSYNHLIEGDLNILLVVFQAVAAVICVEFSKFMGWVEYPNFNTQTARLWAPVNLFFCGMLFTGMASMQHNSVPMVTVFKNITNIMTSTHLLSAIISGATLILIPYTVQFYATFSNR